MNLVLGTGANDLPGRFNERRDPYRSLYVSFDPGTAVAERFLAGRAFDAAGRRSLPRHRVAATVATQLRVQTELVLLRLVEEGDFRALGQVDDWLVTVGPEGHRLTRRWVAWLRAQLPEIHGIVWQSVHAMPRRTAVIFGDRCTPDAVGAEPDASIELDDSASVLWLNQVAGDLRLVLPDPIARPLVFVNYRSGDDNHAVISLDDELITRFGVDAVFRDLRSIKPTTDFRTLIVETAARSRVLVAVIGPRWEQARDNKSAAGLPDWTRREIAAALSGGVRVLPLLVGARAMPLGRDLPEDIRDLASHQLLHLKHNYGQRDVAAVVDDLISAVPSLRRGADVYRHSNGVQR